METCDRQVNCAPAPEALAETTTSDMMTQDSGNVPCTAPDNPVSVCDIDLSKLTLDQFTEAFDFNTDHKGQRRTAFFGPVTYEYGRYKHKAADYPDSPLLDEVFSKLQSIDSTVTNTLVAGRNPACTSRSRSFDYWRWFRMAF